MDGKILNHLAGKLKEQQQMQEAALVGGAAKDFAEYRELVGVIRGLRVAQNEVEDLRSKMERNNDD